MNEMPILMLVLFVIVFAAYVMVSLFREWRRDRRRLIALHYLTRLFIVGGTHDTYPILQYLRKRLGYRFLSLDAFLGLQRAFMSAGYTRITVAQFRQGGSCNHHVALTEKGVAIVKGGWLPEI